jgi:hypothetical protein
MQNKKPSQSEKVESKMIRAFHSYRSRNLSLRQVSTFAKNRPLLAGI